MSRYSPTVQPTGVNPFASAIASLGEGLDEGRDIRHEREDRAANERRRRLEAVVARAQLARLGVVPDEMLAGDNVPDGPTGESASPLAAMAPVRTPPRGTPGVPPPVSGSIAGSPQYQAGMDDPAALFGEMAANGRPAPEPPAGSWHPETGFYGLPTSKYAGPISVGDGMSLDPRRTPEALAEQRAAEQAAASAKGRRDAFDYEEGQRRTTADNELVQVIGDDGVRRYVRRGSAVNARAPQPSEPLVEVVGADGQRHYVARSSAEGQKAPANAIQWGKFQTPAGPRVLTMEEGSRMGYAPLANEGGASGFGAGGVSGAGRTLAGIEGLKTAHNKMLEFENAVASGKASFSGWDFFKTQVGKMYDDHGYMNQAGVAAALSNINRTNPALAEYLQAELLWALEESALSNRPSDFRTKLDEFVSSLKPEAGAAPIRFMQEGRSVRVRGWERTAPAIESMLDRAAGKKDAGAAAGNGAMRLAVASQAEYDHLVAPKPNGAGMTDAQVAARYDIPAAIKRRGTP